MEAIRRSVDALKYNYQLYSFLWHMYTPSCLISMGSDSTLKWRRNEHDGVSNHQPHGWLLKRLFMRRSKKTSKLRVTGLCEGNSPVTGEFPAQRASKAENVPIWWRHHDVGKTDYYLTTTLHGKTIIVSNIIGMNCNYLHEHYRVRLLHCINWKT